MKNQTPTWVIITAILMMLVGGCGIKNDIQAINIREMIHLKDKLFDKIVTSNDEANVDSNHQTSDTLLSDSAKVTIMEKDSISTAIQDTLVNHADSLASNESKNELDEVFGKIFDMPEETIKLFIILGYVGLFFSLLFVLGGLFLLLKKPFSIKLAYTALGANIFFAIVRWILMSGKGGTLLSISNSVGSVFSIIVFIIILVIIISSDKSYLEEQFTD